jgi:glycine/D-amino acid oxidase-like deaminating enzyme
VVTTQDHNKRAYTKSSSSFDNDIALGVRLTTFEDGDTMRSRSFPPGVPVAPFTGKAGYLNDAGGWANAAQGISIMITKVTSMGGQVLPGNTVIELLRKNGRISGVKCSNKNVFDADVVILAAGSWTAASFPDLGLGKQCLATGYVKVFSPKPYIYIFLGQAWYGNYSVNIRRGPRLSKVSGYPGPYIWVLYFSGEYFAG